MTKTHFLTFLFVFNFYPLCPDGRARVVVEKSFGSCFDSAIGKKDGPSLVKSATYLELCISREPDKEPHLKLKMKKGVFSIYETMPSMLKFRR